MPPAPEPTPRAAEPRRAVPEDVPRERRRIAGRAITLRDGLVGVFQILALFAGISRSGVTMVAGLFRGLNHEDAARFAFLLATPVIFAAGVLKLPDLPAPPATTSAARCSPAS